MHRIHRLLTGAIVALAAAACRNDSAAPSSTPSTANPLLVAIARAGFDTAGARDLGDQFAIEQDILISKAVAARWAAGKHDARPGGPSFQWRTTNLVGQTKIYGLKVDLSGLASEPAWQSAAVSALAEWNNVGSSAVYLVQGTPADITIQAAYLHPDGCGVAAAASWPDGTNPGPTITVYTGFCGSPNTNSTKLRNVVHEIGHTLGFRHSNWHCRPPSCQSEGQAGIGAIQVPGTPSLDANSVMNGGTATVSWGGFSANDKLAVRTLYPRVASVVINSGSALDDVTGPNSWNYNVGISAYDVNGNYIPGKVPQSITLDHPSIAQINVYGQLEGLQPGSTTLRATIDGITGTAPVQVSTITITGPSSLGMTESGTFGGVVTGPTGPYQALYWTSGEHNPLGCDGQASCTVTGSQVWYSGEGYMQVVFRNQSTGNFITAWVPVAPE
ncbi:MAG: hypothetical protein HOP28_09330 [Gemmatimonadales bacterium]|nr:hypothetical protein [Gemmatimonadales bacterium]